ncbi:MAG: SDR family NAD(P)-dependent oxidoreductase [Rhodospirillaceae bacterium]
MAGRETALIVGAGQGLSASLTRLFAAEGMKVAIAARNTVKLGELCDETGAKAYVCDAVKPGDVAALFAAVAEDMGAPDIVVYNASNRARGPVQDLDPGHIGCAVIQTGIHEAVVQPLVAETEGPEALLRP